jgi:hypothetical protein
VKSFRLLNSNNASNLMNHYLRIIFVALGIALLGFALVQPEIGGAWLASGFVAYGIAFLVIPSALFLNVLLLGVLVWGVVAKARGREAWPKVPLFIRKNVRLAVEIVFGLLNPVLYLAILTTSFPSMNRPRLEWWFAPLTTIAWILLALFWTFRLGGAAFDPRSRTLRAVARTLLVTSLACLIAYAVKDLWLMIDSEWGNSPLRTFLLNLLRVSPLYLIPAVLLWDYLRATSAPDPQAGESEISVRQSSSFFLLPTLASRLTVAALIGIALLTLVLTAHRRSETTVRKLLSAHRSSILAAANRYDINPRLIAAIVYVTHRDQLSPFRDAFERLLINAWAMNLHRRNPSNERWEELGTDENPMLNISLDISVGLAQIKPRTALTASVLATGEIPDTLANDAYHEYRNVEPVGDGWPARVTSQLAMNSPIPVPTTRRTVARMLLNAQQNLETCALILALYRSQWETTNRDWSIRERPDISATLYQIGFARSKPHAAPRSNAFGKRVREVYNQPWLGELF